MPSHNKLKLSESRQTYLPPRPSILSLSLGSSGLWSCVTSTALTKSSLGSSWTPSTTPESPTWATYILEPRMITTLAVVPDVLGRPVMVLGHSAARRNRAQHTQSTGLVLGSWECLERHLRGLWDVRASARPSSVPSSPHHFNILPKPQLKLTQTQLKQDQSTTRGF